MCPLPGDIWVSISSKGGHSGTNGKSGPDSNMADRIMGNVSGESLGDASMNSKTPNNVCKKNCTMNMKLLHCQRNATERI